MIKNIHTTNPEFIKVEVSYPGVAYTSASSGGVGALRYNPGSGNIEVWDGFNWTSVNCSATISLTQDAKELLEWARKERARQATLEEKAKTNVTLRNAVDALYAASEAVEVIEILSEPASISGDRY